MAAQGGIKFQEKVRKLISKNNGRPVLKPNRPLILKDTVGNKKLSKGEATCVSEMTILMACWKDNNFTDSLCSREIKSFYACLEVTRAARRQQSEQTSLPGGRMHPKLATTLLKRFPTLPTEI